MTIDDLTKRWIRNPCDEKAAAQGMRWSLRKAAWNVWWIGRYCRLYEGEHAGEPMVLRGAHSQPLFASQLPWASGGQSETEIYIRDYMEAQAGGEPCDWQLEVHCQLYGWQCFSERWKAWIRRYQRFMVFIAKKNKKSPEIAANALYLGIGDGEPGQKVYLCASTGDQAKEIAGRHAIEMVRSSPELTLACEIEKASFKIEHPQSKSLITPLHSGNVAAQKAREGLNGSGLVDEAHVVTSAFVGRIKRMGISRRQPLFGGFSTFGDDTTSWGYEQWEFGTKNIQSGEDLHHYFRSYEAKQTASDVEINAHLDDFIRAANPALGHTVDLQEVRQDWKNSQVSEAQKGEVKRYRFNIWTSGKEQWIPLDLWNTSRARRWKQPDPKSFAWGGIYLGRTDEPAALTLVWPAQPSAIDRAMAAQKAAEAILQQALGEVGKQPGPVLLRVLEQDILSRTWYWLPKGAIEKFGHKLPYAEWKRARAATIQRQNTLDMDAIAGDIIKILATADVQALSYDRLISGVLIGAICEAGHYPLPRCFEFARALHQRWAFSVALVERLLWRKRLKCKANIALDWEMGRAETLPDRLGGAYLVEPERGDRNTIAGPASLLMAIDAMAKAPRFYRSRLERL